MMVGKFGWTALLSAALMLSGCGSSSGPEAEVSGPEAVVAQFLAAVKRGDDKQASALLTDVARQKTTEMEIVVAPPGSDTAEYKVLESEVEGDQAQVGTDWTDLDLDGQPRTDRVVWMLKRGSDGWKISGMATRVFPDIPPVILNFEDPADMLAKQQQAEEEIARRQGQLTAENPGGEALGDGAIR